MEEYHIDWLETNIESKAFQISAVRTHIFHKIKKTTAQEIADKASEKFKSKDKDDIGYAVHLVRHYNLYDKVNFAKLCDLLLAGAQLDYLYSLVRDCTLPQEEVTKLKKDMVRKQLQGKKNFKQADALVNSFKLDLMEFPDLVYFKKESAVFYHYLKFLKKKEGDPEYTSLDRIEDLMSGHNDMLAILCENLIKNKMRTYAKGIFLRNKLAENDFRAKGIAKDLVNAKYDEEQDFKPIKDMFEPVSLPADEHLRFPVDNYFVGIYKEADIKQLQPLVGQRFVGVDSEWRPQLTKFHTTQGVATLQLSGKKHTFVVDMIGLRESKKLDDMLCNIFGNPKTTILGFGFGSDIQMFNKSCPKMSFYKDIANLVDIEQMYKKVFPDFKDNGGSSLAKVCQRLLGKKLCKAEQISNWERRPLRYSQEHYGGMDAYILIQIQELLEAEGSKARPPIKTTDFSKPLSQPGAKKGAAPPDGQPEESKEADGGSEAKIKEYQIQLEYH